MVETETINDTNYTPNVAQTVTVGHSVLNNKTYQKTTYAQSYLKVNKKGVLNSSSVPVGMYPDKKYEIQIFVDRVKHIKICSNCHHEGKCLKSIDLKKCDCFVEKIDDFERSKEHLENNSD